MTNGPRVGFLALLALAGCATQPDSRISDVDFVVGCWAQKRASDQTIEASLRLLPGGADGTKSNYSGEIQDATLSGSREPSREGLSFARDGSSASWWLIWGDHNNDPDVDVVGGGSHDDFLRDHYPTPRRGWYRHRAVFKSAYVPGGTLVIEATNERLSISRNVTELVFDGQRTTCD
jgi:hypothetical protein